jgi:hypothetical protein
VSFGGRNGVSRSAAGTYVDYLDNTLNTNALVFTGTGFSGTVDNVEVMDVSDGQVTAPYALHMDGIDDFLTTASVDFTATDKMAVVMGVRKLSDAARGSVVESSAVYESNAGAFSIRSPGTDGAANYSFGAGAVGNRTYGTIGPISAPNSDVISLLINLSQPAGSSEVNARRNGSEDMTSYVTEGNQTGNLGNYPIYFGRRGGTALPFNGLDFGGICVNKTLTASQLSSAERWTASRTGVTL